VFKYIGLLALGFIVSCGTRPAKTKQGDFGNNQADNKLIGSWQAIYDQSGFGTCDPNLDCKCADVINIYDNVTFDRNLKCDYKKGYYEIKQDKLQLTYISEYPQIFSFTLGENELSLVKSDTVYKYIRKPMFVRMDNGGAPIKPTSTPTTPTTPPTGR
jgi:hypothetical protein